jgi:hypothetical protein
MHHSSALQFSDLISQVLVVSSLISNINWTMASAAIVEKAAVIMLVLTLTMGHLMANASPQQPRRLLAIAEEEREVPGKPASLPVLPADAAAAVENRPGCPPSCSEDPWGGLSLQVCSLAARALPVPSLQPTSVSAVCGWLRQWHKNKLAG